MWHCCKTNIICICNAHKHFHYCAAEEIMIMKSNLVLFLSLTQSLSLRSVRCFYSIETQLITNSFIIYSFVPRSFSIHIASIISESPSNNKSNQRIAHLFVDLLVCVSPRAHRIFVSLHFFSAHFSIVMCRAIQFNLHIATSVFVHIFYVGFVLLKMSFSVACQEKNMIFAN